METICFDNTSMLQPPCYLYLLPSRSTRSRQPQISETHCHPQTDLQYTVEFTETEPPPIVMLVVYITTRPNLGGLGFGKMS